MSDPAIDRPPPYQPTDRLILQVITLARWAIWIWIAFTTYAQRGALAHPALAVGIIALLFVVATGCTLALKRHSAVLLRPTFVIAEVILGWALLVADGWVYKSGHAFAEGQNLSGEWPTIAVIGAAIGFGPWVGAMLAAAIGTGRWFGALTNGLQTFTKNRALSLASTVFFYAIAAVVFGAMARRLRNAENEIAMSRARDEVARTLHDGVLQTLALVDRRTSASDPELAAVARSSDRELRAWLFHGVNPDQHGGSLEDRLRRAADKVAKNFDLSISVSIIDDPDGIAPDDAMCVTVAAAAGEAMTNAGKHAQATKVVVFGEIDDDGEIFVSVTDNGVGFDLTTQPIGRGIAQSIQQRMANAGGAAAIRTTPNHGTEVKLWSKRPAP